MKTKLPYYFALALVVASSLSTSDMYIGDSLVVVVPLAVIMGLLLFALLAYRAFLSASLLILYGMVYFTGSQRALDRGFSDALLPVTPSAVRWALGALVAFWAIASVVSIVCARLPPATVVAGAITRWIDFPEKVNLIRVLSGAAFILTVYAFLNDGWSSYTGGGDHGGAPSDSAFEIAYPPMVFLLVGSTFRQAVVDYFLANSPLRKRLIVIAALAVGVFLAFILQSRRMMIGALLVGGVTAMAEITSFSGLRTGLTRWIPVIAAAGAMVFLLWASYLWRTGLRTGGNTLEDRFSSLTADTQAPQEAGAFEQGIGRLTYLWVDSYTVEYVLGAPVAYRLEDLLLTQTMVAIPFILFPEKRDMTRISCERLILGPFETDDLPCTPVTESLATGGWGSLAMVAALWGLMLAIADRAQQQRTLGGVLAGLALSSPFVLIEIGVAPWATSFRVAGMVMAIAGLAALPRVLAASAQPSAGRA